MNRSTFYIMGLLIQIRSQWQLWRWSCVPERGGLIGPRVKSRQRLPAISLVETRCDFAPSGFTLHTSPPLDTCFKYSCHHAFGGLLGQYFSMKRSSWGHTSFYRTLLRVANLWARWRRCYFIPSSAVVWSCGWLPRSARRGSGGSRNLVLTF